MRPPPRHPHEWQLTGVSRAGGGGSKSKLRREKLAVKNRKLDEERQRLASERQKDKTERRAQAGDQGNGMHPSRRRRLQ